MDEFAHFRSGIDNVLRLADKPHMSDQDRERLRVAVKQRRTGRGPAPMLIPELENLRDRLLKLLDDADRELRRAQVVELEQLIYSRLPELP